MSTDHLHSATWFGLIWPCGDKVSLHPTVVVLRVPSTREL